MCHFDKIWRIEFPPDSRLLVIAPFLFTPPELRPNDFSGESHSTLQPRRTWQCPTSTTPSSSPAAGGWYPSSSLHWQCRWCSRLSSQSSWHSTSYLFPSPPMMTMSISPPRMTRKTSSIDSQLIGKWSSFLGLDWKQELCIYGNLFVIAFCGDRDEELRERSGEQWTEVVSWEPRVFIYHKFLVGTSINVFSFFFPNIFCY